MAEAASNENKSEKKKMGKSVDWEKKKMYMQEHSCGVRKVKGQYCKYANNVWITELLLPEVCFSLVEIFDCGSDTWFN